MTREDIIKKVETADKKAVAKRTGYSMRTIKAILADERKDKRGVINTLAELIQARESISDKAVQE